MKKLDKLTLYEIEELAEFQNHRGSVMGDMSEYAQYFSTKVKKKYQQCYDKLSEIWEVIEELIDELCNGDKRYLKDIKHE